MLNSSFYQKRQGYFHTILADPPWRFRNCDGKMALEHKLTNGAAHLYLWVPDALLPDGLCVMEAWGNQTILSF